MLSRVTAKNVGDVFLRHSVCSVQKWYSWMYSAWCHDHKYKDIARKHL